MLSTGYTTKGIIDPSVTIPFFTNLSSPEIALQQKR